MLSHTMINKRVFAVFIFYPYIFYQPKTLGPYTITHSSFTYLWPSYMAIDIAIYDGHIQVYRWRIGNVKKMSLKFTFKNINRVAGSNVIPVIELDAVCKL